MCGIVGAVNFSGKYVAGMESAMRQLLWADTLRGGDATGVYCVTKELKVDWAKATVDGWTFCSGNPRAREILRKAEEHAFIIGHNRAATQGAADLVAYAHPVVIPRKIGLVHNGTLNAWPQRNLIDTSKRIEHDSTAIATIIASDGVQQFVNQCYGAWSLAWHDMEKDTLNLYRNEDRPMAIVHTENVIFFGSELGLLMWVIQRNNFKPLKHYYTKPNHLYSFEVGVPEPVVEKIERKFPSQSSYHGSGERFRRQPSYWERENENSAGWLHGMGGAYPSNDDDDSAGSIQLGKSEALRLAEELGRRAREVEQEKEKEGTSGSAVRSDGDREKQSNVHSLDGGKPRVKVMQRWKTFVQGGVCMFSIFHYGELKDHANGRQYNIHADPASPSDFPEVQIRGVVKEAYMPQEVVQKASTYFTGKISTISTSDTGNIIIWVVDVQTTTVADPAMVKRKGQIVDAAGEVFNSDEIAEATVLLPPEEKGTLLTRKRKVDLNGQEFCQCCSALQPKEKLRFLNETSVGPTGANIHHQIRICEGCLILYGEDREKVVPAGIKGQSPKSADIRKFH